MIKSLRKVDFSHPTGNYRYILKIIAPPPIEKILGAPLPRRNKNLWVGMWFWVPESVPPPPPPQTKPRGDALAHTVDKNSNAHYS